MRSFLAIAVLLLACLSAVVHSFMGHSMLLRKNAVATRAPVQTTKLQVRLIVESVEEDEQGNAAFDLEEEDNFEEMLKTFKRATNNCGHLFELKNKEAYERPAEKRKRKSKEARMKDKMERVKDREELMEASGGQYGDSPNPY